MRENLKDPQRLEHILESINNLETLNREIDIINLSEKDVRYFGIIKLLEIIGEAAYMLSKDFISTHPATPWNLIIKMRHILVHGYYLINKKDLHKTINEDLMPLKLQIQEYLKEFVS